MDYSITVPNVESNTDPEEFRARVLETAYATGITANGAWPNLIDRLGNGSEVALDLMDSGMYDVTIAGSIPVEGSDKDHRAIAVRRKGEL